MGGKRQEIFLWSGEGVEVDEREKRRKDSRGRVKGPCCMRDTTGGSLVWLDRLGQVERVTSIRVTEMDIKGTPHKHAHAHTRTWMANERRGTYKSRSCLLATCYRMN